ncbi:MAG TPA: response regulator [Pyrinomonadaceae bacterium]|nr:response regulator [Pyrinomonadaceae bacterium]
MLAGRKLLLADDSITIQKVVALTFADEGVEVLCAGNGRDAIDRLVEFQPDVVLADVFMPQVNGYEVCEFIKQNAQLKHIPVMLLVGSFEPFDEAEARRVGADDTLTKPFQSIRNLIDKVGALVSGRPPEEQIPTAELPKPEVQDDLQADAESARHPEPEPERLSEAELDFVTADTQPLPSELAHMIEESAARENAKELISETETKVDEGEMETEPNQGSYEAGKFQTDTGGAGDALLDLGGLEGATSRDADDFVLDLDLDEAPDSSAYQPSAYVRRPVYKSPPRDWQNSVSQAGNTNTAVDEFARADQFAHTEEYPAPVSEIDQESRENDVSDQPTVATETSSAASETGKTSLEGLSPEVIDAIARRAVEHLSEKVVREIAWEVVPDLAELLIKRQLEENKT